MYNGFRHSDADGAARAVGFTHRCLHLAVQRQEVFRLGPVID